MGVDYHPVVFELPVKRSSAEFPADKFQARFRVLFVNVSRAFEVQRTDFNRVVPFDESAAPEK